MDKFIVIKNGLVLTLDDEGKTGYFNIVIKNDKIFRIDYENDLNRDARAFLKYPGAHIIDAKDKLIIPSFINSFLNSTHTLNHFFLNSCTYSNIDDNISLNLIEKHFSNPENKVSFKNLVAFTYFKSLYNGETSILDFSKLISKDFLIENFKYNFISSQDVVFTSFENTLNQFLDEHRIFHVLGVKNEEDINNYSLNSLKRMLSTGNKRLLLEVMQKSDSNQVFRQAFSKSLINVLKENDLLNSKTIFVNPVYINSEEIEKIGNNKANVIICPSDLLKLSERQVDVEEFLLNNVNLSLGTGFTGFDILSETKLFNSLLKRSGVYSETLLRLITTNAAKTFEKDISVGSINESKLANLIFFDLSVIHNLLNVPEIDSERVCEFIIENLTVKDISDVITRGSFVKRNYQCRFYDPEMLRQIHCTLIKQIYDTGKYFEFKENYLRRKRVKELTRRASDVKETIISETKDTEEENFILNDSETVSDSEFRIIGVHKADYSFTANDIFNTDSSRTVTIEELDALDSGLKLFGEEENEQEENLETTDEKFSGKSVMDKQNPGKLSNESQTEKDSEKTKDKNVTFKKEKLRFGFSDED